MAEQHHSRRPTRADAVVLAAVGLLLILLVPVLLARPRERAVRTLCAANLAQIGKTMFVYANDHEDELPRAGGPASMWGKAVVWDAPDRWRAYGLNADGSGGQATISSCFYLLVKYYDAPTRLFICRGDRGTTEFKLSDIFALPWSFKLTDAWDFGPTADARRHCSYSYHMPFGLYSLTTASDPNMAVAADRNPWIVSPMAAAADLILFIPDIPPWRGTAERARAGNAITHQWDGQNVLFLDGRVTFEKRSYCGFDSDNIYLISTRLDGGSPIGMTPTIPCWPANRHDSVLVHDPDTFSGGIKPPPPNNR